MTTKENTRLYTPEGKFKLDMDTGEWVKVRSYKVRRIVVRCKPDDEGREKTFIWNTATADTTTADTFAIDEEIRDMQNKDNTRGRKPNTYCNAYLHGMFEPCQHYSNATLTFPFLEDTLIAVAGFHDGNKPMSIYTMYRLLSTLDSYSTAIVQDATGYSERYSRKVVMALKVVGHELTRMMKGLDVTYIEGDLPMVDEYQCAVDLADYVNSLRDKRLAA